MSSRNSSICMKYSILRRPKSIGVRPRGSPIWDRRKKIKLWFRTTASHNVHPNPSQRLKLIDPNDLMLVLTAIVAAPEPDGAGLDCAHRHTSQHAHLPKRKAV